MKDDLIKQALASFDAIIRDELDGDDPQKYTRVIAIASQAHKIRRMMKRATPRVADVLDGEAAVPGIGLGHHGYHHNLGLVGIRGNHELELAVQGEIADPPMQGNFDQIVGGPPIVGGFGGRHPPDPGDMMDVFREMAMTLAPDPIERNAKRLNALVETKTTMRRAGLSTAAIDAQIQSLTEALAKKETPDATDAAPHPALVHSEFLRRHPARTGEHEVVPPDRREDDGAREDGARQASGGGIEEAVVADVQPYGAEDIPF